MLNKSRVGRQTMFDGHGLDLSNIPDPTSVEELRSRQTNIGQLCEDDSLLIIVNNPEATRSADVEYPYRASSDMLYFVGWNRPDAVFCLANKSGELNSILFIPPRDVLKETWTGIRLGLEGAEKQFPIDRAVSIDEISTVLGTLLDGCTNVFHQRGLSSEVDGIVDLALLETSRNRQRTGSGPANLCDPRPLVSELRLFKSESELELMRHSCKIASAAHIEAMRNASAGMAEFQLQAIIEGCFVNNGSQWSYPSIVGAGDNATILHYVENDSPIFDGDLVLIDAGCEISGYASDITRTWPINGKFTEHQAILYQLVLDSQIAAISACKPGESFDAPHNAAKEVMAQGLLDLGIVEGPTLNEAMSHEQLGTYFMHRTSHWIGLDVHDVGVYAPDDDPRLLQQGMVLTIEPGLYFGAWRTDIEIDKKWAGIGIRIEDDVLITNDGHEILTHDCPKTIQELEDIIGASS
jgi:Xaa-Pro aminopeptidase|tara:strand:+ start:715 stop:2112 length:1398 start_codon:yes stop_codon:yes gene_type:complete